MLIYDNLEGNEIGEIQNFRFQNVGSLSAPSSPSTKKGLFRYLTTDETPYFFNGTDWLRFTKLAAANVGDIGLASGNILRGNGSNQAASVAPSNIRLDELGLPTGSINLNNQRLLGLQVSATPNDSDAASVGYVNAVAQGLAIKTSARVGTVGALLSNTQTGNTLIATGNGALPSIDSVSLSLDDVVLVKNEASASKNGLYYVTNLGSAGTQWVLTRTPDADTGTELLAAFVFVREGATNANTGWTQTTDAPITINSTSIVWTQFSGAGSYTAGNGMVFNGTTVHFATSSSYSTGDLFYASGSTAVGRLGIGTANKMLTSAGPTPAWSNATYPGMTANLTANGILFGSSTTAVGQITPANSSVLVTNGSGVPSLATDLPTAVTIGSNYIYRASGTDIAMSDGGTGASLTAANGAIVYSTGSAMALGTGTNNHFVRWNTSGAPGSFDLFGTANTFTETNTFNNPSTSSTRVALSLSRAALTSDGFLASDSLEFRSNSYASSTNTVYRSVLNYGPTAAGSGFGNYNFREQIGANSERPMATLNRFGITFGETGTIGTADSTYVIAANSSNFNFLSGRPSLTIAAPSNTAAEGFGGHLYLIAGTSNVGSTINNAGGSIYLVPGFLANGTEARRGSIYLGWSGTGTDYGRVYYMRGSNPFSSVITVGSDGLLTNTATAQVGYVLSSNTGAGATWFNLFGTSNVWTAGQQLALGTTQANAIDIQATALSSNGTRASHFLNFKAYAYEGASINVDWRMSANPLQNDGEDSEFKVENRFASESWITRFRLTTASLGFRGTSLIFNEGATSGTIGTLAWTVTSADKTITLPDRSGTVALTTGTTFGSGSVWQGSNVGTTYGGTGVNLSAAPQGAIAAFASAGTFGATLAPTAVRQTLFGNTTGVPTWSPYALPATVATNDLLLASSSTAISVLNTANSRVLTTDGSGNVSWGISYNPARNAVGFARKYSNLVVGDNTNTYITVTHGLGTRDVTLSVRNSNSGDTSTQTAGFGRWDVIDSNTVRVYFSSVQTSSTYYVVTVIG